MIEAALTSLPAWGWAPLVHLVCGLLGAVLLSGVVVKAILTGLRYLNEGGEVPRDAFALPTGPGLASAGLLIGGFERVLTYLAVVAGAPQLLGVLLAVKTVVRYPSVRADAEAAAEGGEEASQPGRFAEYYLVGTLASVTQAILWALAARAALGA